MSPNYWLYDKTIYFGKILDPDDKYVLVIWKNMTILPRVA